MVAAEDLRIINDAAQAFGGGGDGITIGGRARAAGGGGGGADLLSGLARPFDGTDIALDAETVLAWNQRTLDAIQAGAASPLLATRALAMESLAVHAVVDAVDGAPTARLARPETLDTISTAAVAAAVHSVLRDAFPAQGAAFDAALAQDLAGVPDGLLENAAVALGRLVGNAVVALRARDGWNDAAAYEGGANPGEWRPTPPGFLPALAPHWDSVGPFALDRPDRFRPAGPPDLAGPGYAAALEDVKRLGPAASAERTAEQTEIALFWADGAGTYTPPGHWNEIAADVAERAGLGGAEAARMLAALNVALADAGIAAWDAKYTYGFWRPVTAVRLADADGNPATAADPAWSPLLVTPNHPEYVSGHAAFSGAAAVVLTNFFGDADFSATSGVALPGVTRDFDGFDDAAAEAGRSRIFGGIHFEFSNQDGLAMGRAIGDWALDAFR